MDLELLDEQLNRDDQSIDIRSVQRNGKKYITTIEGLGNDVDMLKTVSKDLRKLLNTSCAVSDGNIIKLAGNDHDSIIKYLKKNHNILKVRVNSIEVNLCDT
jgi:translation initiation factor 1 (eIF-1/SUI1)